MKWTLCLFLGALGFVAGSQSTVDNLSCDLCFENGFRYIKDKFRFLCVPRVIPAMRARFIYTKADCLKLKIDQRLLVGSQYVVSSNVSDHMPRRIPTEAPLADRLQSMESVFNTSKLPVSTLKSLESSQPFFTAQPSTTVAPRQLPSQRMATMPSMSRVGITQPPRQLSTTTPIPATTQPPKLTTATTVANKMGDAPPVTESASVMSMGIPVPGSEFIAIPIPGNWSDANLDQEEIHPINLTFVENGTGLPFVGNSQKLNPQNETKCTNASKRAHPDWKLSQSNGRNVFSPFPF